jgi:polyisoprenoid-binding protein YceI
MRRRTKLILAALLVVLVAAGGGLWWYFRDDNPPKPTIDAASQGVGTTAATTDAAADPPAGGIAGTWAVDTEHGHFDFESATGTFVGFRIKEHLSSIGSTHAVGRTGDVSGTMVIDGTKVTSAKFDVDLTTITTNQTQRNQRVQDALETDRFPNATFELTSPIDLGGDAADGRELSVTAKGDLTIHGQTRPVSFPLQAKLVRGTVVVVGSLDVTFSDFGVEVPRAPIVLSVDDHGQLELQLLLTRT